MEKIKWQFWLQCIVVCVWVGMAPAYGESERIEGLDPDTAADRTPQGEMSSAPEGGSRVIYPKKTELDLDAMQIEGQLKNPGEFYFQVKPEDKMDSLVKRRKNFHRQMLRDVMFSK